MMTRSIYRNQHMECRQKNRLGELTSPSINDGLRYQRRRVEAYIWELHDCENPFVEKNHHAAQADLHCQEAGISQPRNTSRSRATRAHSPIMVLIQKSTIEHCQFRPTRPAATGTCLLMIHGEIFRGGMLINLSSR
jgi:hypothetical protein